MIPKLIGFGLWAIGYGRPGEADLPLPHKPGGPVRRVKGWSPKRLTNQSAQSLKPKA